MKNQSAVVVGAGAFGAWTAYFLAQRGFHVSLFDAWGSGHSRSSSGGETRVIRAVYGAEPLYVDMAAQSIRLWREFETRWNTTCYIRTGELWLFGQEDDGYARLCAPHLATQGLDLYKLDKPEAAKRYPLIQFDDLCHIYLEPEAGLLFARRSVQQVSDALAHMGGKYRIAKAEPAESSSGFLNKVRLSNGETIEADVFVFACGPWLPKLFPDLFQQHLMVTRQEVYFFGTPAGDKRWNAPHFPVWSELGQDLFYGIPGVENRGFKIADDGRYSSMDPEVDDRRPTHELLQKVRNHLARRFPMLANAPLVESRVCQYTNTKDGNFIIDKHPGFHNVWLAGAGCGHAFKMGPAVGNLLARQIAENLPPPSQFVINRLSNITAPHTQFEAYKN